MDTETISKVIVPLLAGAMVLAGGIFTFVNGRLNEAKSADSRSRVISLTNQLLSLAFGIGGMAMTIFLKVSLWSLLPYTVCIVFQIADFLRQPVGSVRRIELVGFCLILCSFTFLVVVNINAYYLSLVLDQMGQMSEQTGQLAKEILDIDKQIDRIVGILTKLTQH